MRDRVREAIAHNDLDELVRIVDDAAADRAWDDVLWLRDRSRAAFEDTGRQLWPAASWAEYRLALHGPADMLGEVLGPSTGRFAPGPLAEVASQEHRWADVRAHLEPGPTHALVAHECAARGEVVVDDVVASNVLAVPLRRGAWEPAYVSAHYTTDGIEPVAPDAPRGAAVDSRRGAEPLVDNESLDAVEALFGVVRAWVASSDAVVHAVAVDGDELDAIGAIVGAATVAVAPLAPAEALEWLGWAGASAGRRGPRRGAAAGRDAAWHAASALCGFDPHDDVTVDELGDAVGSLRWWWWGLPGAAPGHSLRLAVVDPDDAIAFAIAATDSLADSLE